MRQRAPIARPLESREFSDRLLAEVAAGGWRPRAWARFWARSCARSGEQIRRHPRTAAEITAAHLALALAGVGRRWVAVSWLLTITHLGLLGDGDRGLGLPSLLSLARANLPAIPQMGRALPWLAMASDVLDGLLARRMGQSALRAYLDAVADIAFWSWFAERHERNRWLRAAGLALWAGPVASVTVDAFARGRTQDYPRPLAVTPPERGPAAADRDPGSVPSPVTNVTVRPAGFGLASSSPGGTRAILEGRWRSPPYPGARATPTTSSMS